MTAPAAPVITYRAATVGSLRLRWAAVTGATSYKVYRDAVLQSTVTDVVAVVQVSDGEALTVTALNAGLEESAVSNTVRPQNMGGATSFGPPRSPFG